MGRGCNGAGGSGQDGQIRPRRRQDRWCLHISPFSGVTCWHGSTWACANQLSGTGLSRHVATTGAFPNVRGQISLFPKEISRFPAQDAAQAMLVRIGLWVPVNSMLLQLGCNPPSLLGWSMSFALTQGCHKHAISMSAPAQEVLGQHTCGPLVWCGAASKLPLHWQRLTSAVAFQSRGKEEGGRWNGLWGGQRDDDPAGGAAWEDGKSWDLDTNPHPWATKPWSEPLQATLACTCCFAGAGLSSPNSLLGVYPRLRGEMSSCPHWAPAPFTVNRM